jgi:hypothetical protein
VSLGLVYNGSCCRAVWDVSAIKQGNHAPAADRTSFLQAVAECLA